MSEKNIEKIKYLLDNLNLDKDELKRLIKEIKADLDDEDYSSEECETSDDEDLAKECVDDTLRVKVDEKDFMSLDLEFKNSTTLSKIIDPDLRVTQLEVSNGALPALSGGGGSSSDRLWRNLNEFNDSLNFDISYSFSKYNKIILLWLGTLHHRISCENTKKEIHSRYTANH